MITREQDKRAARKGENYGDGSELFGDWLPHSPRAAQFVYDMMDAAEWKLLPDAGGFMDQDEALMEDAFLLARMSGFVRAQLDANEQEALALAGTETHA